MDFHFNFPSSSSSSSSSSSFASGVTVGGRTRDRRSSAVSRLGKKFICAIVACVFATVGLFVGAMTGALIGLASECGLFRGAGIGALSGAVFSIEVAESSLTLWRSHHSGIWSFLFVLDIFASLLSGRLVREKVGPAVQSAVQSQMNAVDYSLSSSVEPIDIFETGGGTVGMSEDCVSRLGTTEIGADSGFDVATGERICCSVCLQDFESGETARSLPHCRHMFHLQCIDSWLVRQASCPLCRRDV